MQPDNEDEAWRAIVENYGARADLDPEDEPAAPRRDAGAPEEHGHPAERDALDDLDDPDDLWVEERFEPPAPPPMPRPPRDRLVAWVGLLGSPALLLACVILGVALPTWVALVLVGAFVAGFGYLVARMPREPRDPWDDGAQV